MEEAKFLPSQSPLQVRPCLTAILKCFYGLNQLEVDIFSLILNNGEKNIKQLAEKFERDESVVYRALKTLWELGLLKKKKVKRGIGRPYHVYYPIEKEELRSKLLDIAEGWYRKVKDILESL